MPKKVSSSAKVKARSKRQIDRKYFGLRAQHNYGVSVSKRQLEIIASTSGSALRGADRLRADLEAAFAQFGADQLAGLRLITSHDLQDDLTAIEEAARGLAKMLTDFREAEDAMVRAVRPQYDVPTLLREPIAPPMFSYMAVEIYEAAAAAQKSTSPKPYVQAERGQLAVNNLIDALLAAWDNAFEPAPTFGFTPRTSAFISFVCACFKHIGLPIGELEALSKKCRRIHKARQAARETAG